MKVTIWNDGGTTYGVRVGSANRDAHFDRRWTEIELELDGKVYSIPISKGFWNKCPEVRSPMIREWLMRRGLTEWPKGKPPRLELHPVSPNRFRLSTSTD